jgi:predicted metal-dependent HD superfamily phosphohydrolase
VDDLITGFRTALADLRGTAADDRSTAAARDLIARWSEPHRHYHAIPHLRAMLSIVDDDARAAPAAADGSPRATPADLAAVRLACWFHDAIYDPRRPDNEEASAVLASSMLASLDCPGGEVARLVRLTATHDPDPEDHNGQLLCDADLAILAAPPQEYARYVAAIRAEYAHVPDEAFRAGRAAVLRSLLANPVLFRIEQHRRNWEEAARVNMHNEMSVLTDGR